MSDEIDRKFSNGSCWDNSIDFDDASDGSEGGYDRHGNFINANGMMEIITLRVENDTLRDELAAAKENLDAYDMDGASLYAELKKARADLAAAIKERDEARAKVIEECAKVVRSYEGSDTIFCATDAGREGYRIACREIDIAIRALAAPHVEQEKTP